MTSFPRACTIWFTGLFGEGKSMIIDALAPELRVRGAQIEILDEEVVRVDINRDFVLSQHDRPSPWQCFALTCLQSPASAKFVIFPAGAFETAPEEVEVVCDLDHDSPHEGAQKILRKLEQLDCFAPFWRNERHVYSAAEEAAVTQRLEELGYV